MRRQALLVRAVSAIMMVLLAMPLPAMAQNGSDNGDKQDFSREQLAQMLAPIALYPDELIAQILIASTYPLEIVMADRWVRQNQNLKGNELARALDAQTWDPSVKSLVNFPSILSMLSEKLDLTTKLGDAFLEQKQEVMDTIQELRRRARDAGNLNSSGQQKVVVEKETIIIEPAQPDVVYVPVYDPFVVYGPWWYPAYPPFYFYSSPGVAFSFSIGIPLGLAWGYSWGYFDWYQRNIFINVNRHYSYNRYIDRGRYIRRYEARRVVGPTGEGVWTHNPVHRRGVAYVNRATASRFGQMPARSVEGRREIRGFRSGAAITPAPRTAPPVQAPVQAPVLRRGGGTVDRGVQRTSEPRAMERGIRGGEQGVSAPARSAPRREGVFTGSFGEGERTRRSSDRGQSSFGRGGSAGSFSQPRGGGVSQPRGGGGGGRGREIRR